MRNGFFKGHALGNDYLVMDPRELDFPLAPENVRAICDRHRGIGADGILVPRESSKATFGLTIWNPDGTTAERSGNGLRIFARWLHATRRTRRTEFTVETEGGIARIQLHTDRHGEASRATVEMGRATFGATTLPCTLAVEELVEQPIEIGGRKLAFTGVNVGNPHCVVFRPKGEEWSAEDLRELGPPLSSHRIFPKGANVQLAVPKAPRELFLRIWERGAGETTASGSSACAAAAAGVRLGLVKSPVTVQSAGGSLEVVVDRDYRVTLHGPVEEVARGRLSSSFLRTLR